MKYFLFIIAITIVVANQFISCKGKNPHREDMIGLLADIDKKEFSVNNNFCAEAKLKFYDSILTASFLFYDSVNAEYNIGNAYLELGDEQKSVLVLKNVLDRLAAREFGFARQKVIMKALAIAWLRLGERSNCVHDHSGESCIFPLSGKGVHADKNGSQNAIQLFSILLEKDSADLESRWLLNIAYMTTGGYPKDVPPAFLIGGLDAADTSSGVKPFIDAAMNIGVNTKDMAGGSIVDDFNNDGYPDLITSCWGLQEGMHFFENNADGTFKDVSNASGLARIKGGLNIMQTDYNNDGLKDIFVLRGAWKGVYGREPNSLLRNNGDGTFTDVTIESGLLSFHPTQTATWADFNNDGWLDVFIGNESKTNDVNICELYMNNKNGTFKEVAAAAGCNVDRFVKGVTSGDYNNDGLPDIFISTLDGQKVLLKNESKKNGAIEFKDVTVSAGLDSNKTRTFPTWFWDYDNDGWPDILVCGYEFEKSLAWYAAADALGRSAGSSGKIILFRNKHDGTFEDVSDKVGLNKIAFAMGSNFGDIDNDGYLDMYLGTGNPLYQSLVPNKMFKNINGNRFIDITTAARTGNLQKGHAVSFADFNNDGNEDIYIEMGGAYAGDVYPNSLLINPGQNNNNWINLSLEGTVANRSAIGARIKVTFKENDIIRSVYRSVNSGGSFGSNPLQQHIGIGQAAIIQHIEIKWPGSTTTQVFKDIKPDQCLKIKEGNPSYTVTQLRKFTIAGVKPGMMDCYPSVKLSK